MRKLTRNELRLGILFGSAVFIALNLLAGKIWMQHRAAITSAISATSTELAESRSWIDSSEGLQAAGQWMAQHPPPSYTAEQSSSELLKAIRAKAEESGLKVIEENLLPAPTLPVGHASALQMKLSGSFSGVTKFLFAIQGPSDWRSIPRLVIRSDAEPPNVLVDAEVRQYYLPASAVSPATGP